MLHPRAAAAASLYLFIPDCRRPGCISGRDREIEELAEAPGRDRENIPCGLTGRRQEGEPRRAQMLCKRYAD